MLFVTHDLRTNEMLSVATASFSPSLVVWALPLSWVVHDAEELLTVDRWRRDHPELATLADRSRLARRVVAVNSVPRRQFAVAVAVVGLVLVAGTVVAAARLDSWGGVVFAVFLGGYFLHAFGHVAQSVLVRGYTPGVVTAVAVVMPVSLSLYRALFRAGVLDVRLAVTTALAGILVFGPVVVGSHRLAGALVG
jgi:hypothetical protein